MHVVPVIHVNLQVGRAADYVGGGTKALVEAKQYQKSKRKWCCCAIITLLIILIIVFVVVSAEQGSFVLLSSSWQQPCVCLGELQCTASALQHVCVMVHAAGLVM